MQPTWITRAEITTDQVAAELNAYYMKTDESIILVGWEDERMRGSEYEFCYFVLTLIESMKQQQWTMKSEYTSQSWNRIHWFSDLILCNMSNMLNLIAIFHFICTFRTDTCSTRTYAVIENHVNNELLLFLSGYHK